MIKLLLCIAVIIIVGCNKQGLQRNNFTIYPHFIKITEPLNDLNFEKTVLNPPLSHSVSFVYREISSERFVDEVSIQIIPYDSKEIELIDNEFNDSYLIMRKRSSGTMVSVYKERHDLMSSILILSVITVNSDDVQENKILKSMNIELINRPNKTVDRSILYQGDFE